MEKKLVVFLLLFPSFISLHAQDLQAWIDSQKSVLYEKVYLHVDREFYSPGDIIWFKTYLVSGLTHQLLPGYTNIYVQLVSDTGKVYSDRIILSEKGVAHNDFKITDSIPDGSYFIRACTKYLENFREESCFHKRIRISRVKSSPEIEKTPEASHKIDVAFLPESGNLVLNSLNYIAFKAIDETGEGVFISGNVVDENDTVVTAFKSNFRGMGKLVMMPMEGKTYFARIDGYPGFVYRFGDIQENGMALHYKDEGENALFTISRNIKETEQKPIYFVASHKGIVLFYKEMTINGFSDALKIGKNLFPEGISKITLLDLNFKELAERLIFINDSNRSYLKMGINKEEFTTRDKAEVTLYFVPDENDSILSTLSVAVVSKDYFSVNGNSQNMKSYLLLDSELKGAIESPASFFSDDETMTSSEKLDLLMMVQGWRSYYWDELNNYRPEKLTGWNDAGLTVTGYVKALFKNRPIIGGEVVLGPFSRNKLFEETRTDSLGRFKFDRLYLKDSTVIILNAKNEKDRANTEIRPDLVFPFQPLVPVIRLREFSTGQSVPMRFYRENYYRQLKLKEFNPEEGSILLGEVEVIGHLKGKDDGNYRIYGEPDKSFTIKEEDYTYTNIFDYLEGKVAGLVISGDQISIRGGGMPLFLLDGIIVDSNLFDNLIMHAHMSDIDKIEILKSGANMAIFGSQGANGVIAIYTKKGNVNAEINRYVRGRITQRIRGFRKPSQFYSPKYTPENINDLNPDYRPTLYWEPELQLSNNEAKFSFYTSDEMSEYTVIVEGISKKGRICTATGDFSVRGFYNR